MADILFQAFQIIRSKTLAATLCIAWVVVRLTPQYFPQFLKKECLTDEQAYWMDLLAVLACVRLCVWVARASAIVILRRICHAKKLSLKRAAIKELKSFLDTPAGQNEEFFSVIEQLEEGPLLLDVGNPAVQRLLKLGLIVQTGMVMARLDGSIKAQFAIDPDVIDALYSDDD